MKKIIVVLVICVMALGIIGCDQVEQTEVSLSFDEDTVYFKGSKALEPIAGETPVETDIYESATVKLKADTAAVLKLDIEYDEASERVEGLAISVNGAVFDFGEITLYTGSQPETEVSLSIKIYLKQDTDISEAGKTVKFRFVLSYAA